ncbi:MAG: hypothetical protein GY861_17810 [bacterium]|nr:hypothetical protein [bacterium]
MNKIKDLLYSARWGITKGIDESDYSKLDYAADKLIEAKALIIEEEFDEPDRPDTTEQQINDLDKYEIPTIVKLPGIKYKKRGRYKTPSGFAKGLVVHYTVSGRTKRSARSIVNSLAKRGLGCMVMDEEGTIYIPDNFDIDEDVAYHAGPSQWKGKSGVSALCMGMEICNWGKLNSKTKPRADKIRKSKDNDNIKAGEYEEYTMLKGQEEALINFILWQADTNPEFDIEWIVGHDECAVPKGRKSDPGASLSMTMPELRELIRKKIS